MRKLTYRFLLAAILLVPVSLATASTLDVTNNSLVTLQTSDSLLFYISGESFCDHQSNDPGGIQMILGSMPLGGPVSPISGTSGVYIPGILFSGAIESQNRSISIPLTDPDAARLGLPAGDLLLTPGSRHGGSYSGPIDLLSAEITLTPALSAALFSGEAVIDLHNMGAGITFGYPGTSISSDFTASLISPDGHQSMGARIMRVACVQNNVPEPGTMGLLILGLTIIGTRLVRRTATPR